jgi:hypothetical protein
MRVPWAIAVAVLVTAFAGCTSKSTAYPEKYLLYEDDLPSGLKLSELPPGSESFLASNPGQVPDMFIEQFAQQFRGLGPSKVWVEFLEKTARADDDPGGGILIASAYWTDEAKAAQAVDEIKRESRGEVCKPQNMGVALRDANVIVIVGAKAPGLQNVC